MKKSSTSKISFLVGTLDSTKTTHFLGSQEDDKRWWIPKNENAWKDQMINAQATALARILHGDVLHLPRNQFFDSPGWLSLAAYLTKLELPTFSLLLEPGFEPTPEKFIYEITNVILRNPKFSLSGWPGLSMPERSIIASNIEKSEGFSNMFQGIRLDSSVNAFFQEQRDALQSVLGYLEKMKFNDFQMIGTSIGHKTPLWEELKRDFRSKEFRDRLIEKHGEPSANEYLEYLNELITEMPKKARSEVLQESGHTLKKSDVDNKAKKWLNQRTKFYSEISNYPIKIRELLRGHIDWVSQSALAESVIAEGLLGADDGNNSVPYITRQRHLDAIEGTIESSEEIVALPHNGTIDNNTIAEIVEVINDKTIQESIRKLRNLRERKGVSKGELADTEDIHLELLSNNISTLIVDRSNKSWVIDISSKGIGKAIKLIGASTAGGITAMLTNFMVDPQFEKVFLITLAGEMGKESVGEIADKAEESIKPVRDRLKAWLNNKDSKIIAGRIKEWLRSAWKDNKENK